MKTFPSQYHTAGDPGPAISMTACYFCGEPHEILIQTRNIRYQDSRVRAMHGKCIDMTPCNKCKGYMKQGIILITIDDAKSEKDWNKPGPELTTEQRRHWMPNPHRTGGWFVLKDDACKRFITPQSMLDWALAHRWMFIEHEAAEKLGLFEMAKTAPQG